jgi:hypothetical protein
VAQGVPSRDEDRGRPAPVGYSADRGNSADGGLQRLRQAVDRCGRSVSDIRRASSVFFLLIGVLSLTVLGTAAHDLFVVRRGNTVITGWAIPQYWVDYREGFVRRGLPGQVLSWLLGSPPTLSQVISAGLVLSAFALLAVVVLAFQVSALSDQPTRSAMIFVILLASPLTFSLIMQDRGRYDALGIVALPALIYLRTVDARRPWLSAIVGGLIIAIAVASEEFLLAFLAPVALVGSIPWRGWRRPARSIGLLVIWLAPGTAIAAASLLLRPPEHLIESSLSRANAAGSNIPIPNSVSVLGDSLNVERAVVAGIPTRDVLVFNVVLAGCYLVTVFALWALMGGHSARSLAMLTTYYAVWIFTAGGR